MKLQIVFTILAILLTQYHLIECSSPYWGYNPYGSLGYYNPNRRLNPRPYRRRHYGQGSYVKGGQPFRHRLIYGWKHCYVLCSALTVCHRISTKQNIEKYHFECKTREYCYYLCEYKEKIFILKKKNLIYFLLTNEL